MTCHHFLKFLYQQPDPNSSILYNATQNGNIVRIDRKTGNIQGIKPFSSDPDDMNRYDWVTPIMISKQSSKRVYLGGNRLFISNDSGVSWIKTKDLTKKTNRESLSIICLLYTSPSPRDRQKSRMPSSA